MLNEKQKMQAAGRVASEASLRLKATLDRRVTRQTPVYCRTIEKPPGGVKTTILIAAQAPRRLPVTQVKRNIFI